MLVYLVLRVIGALTAFLYPTYASYKTLSRRPADEREIERWLMYWSVLGTIFGTEQIAGWLISWIPFYTPLKTLFLLYLALPHTQGASYIYMHHLHPFLLANEADIDLKIGEIRGRLWAYLSSAGRAALIWVGGVVGVVPGGGGAAGGVGVNGGRGLGGGFDSPPFGSAETGENHATPMPALMMTAPAQLVLGLWRSYGPQIAAFVQQAPAVPVAPATSTTATATAAAQHASTSTSASATQPAAQATTGTSTAVDTHLDLQRNHAQILARRRALEAELAALPPVPTHDPSSSSASFHYGAVSPPHTPPFPYGVKSPVYNQSPTPVYWPAPAPAHPRTSLPTEAETDINFSSVKWQLPRLDLGSSGGARGADNGKAADVEMKKRGRGLWGEYESEEEDLYVVDDAREEVEGEAEVERNGSGSGAGGYWWWGGGAQNNQARNAGYERVKTE